MRNKQHRVLIWAMLAVTVATVVVAMSTDLFRNLAMYGVIHADAQGYYGYLVAGLLQHSFDWEKVISSYANVYFDGNAPDFTAMTDWGRIDKYYVGTAILVLPFFLLSCVAAWLLGYPIDGYSLPFQGGAVVGAVCYVAIGLYALVLFFDRKGIGRAVGIFAALTSFLATGLFHYSVSEPLMSHAYSFSLICIFLWAAGRAFDLPSRGRLALLSAVFALIVLVRPSNGLILLSVPFIAVNVNGRLSWPKLDRAFFRVLVPALVVAVLLFSVQLLMYMLQVGRPLVWAYAGEGFNFTDPHLVDVLFSYRKGFFVYTPWALIGTVGLLLAAIRRRAEGISVLLFLLVTVYVAASWWNWYYGSSFGMRALIDYLPFFAYGLAFLIQSASPSLCVLIVAATAICVPVNLIQTYQYNKFILHWDQMDKTRYWKVFLKTDRKYEGVFYRQPQQLRLPDPDSVICRTVFHTDLDSIDGGDSLWGMQGIVDDKARSGKKSTLVNGSNPFGATLGLRASSACVSGKKILHITVMIWSEQALPDISIAYSYRNAEGDYGHTYIPLDHLVPEAEQWTKVEEAVTIHPAMNQNDLMVIYPYTYGAEDVYLDDIRYEFITLK